MGTVTIKTEEALNDAKIIDNIVSEIETDLADLYQTIKSVIPDGIRTEWSEKLLEEWEQNYKQSIANSIEAMRMSAINLRTAVEQFIAYNK